MAKIGWKTVGGRGPYGSLQRTRRKGPKKGSTEHVRYLGKLGEDGLVPGVIIGKGRDAALAPRVDPDLAASLKPKRRKQLKRQGYIQDEPAGVKELGPQSGPHHRHGPAPGYELIPLNNPPMPADLAAAIEKPAVTAVETAILDQAAEDGEKAVTQVTQALAGDLKTLGASEEHIAALQAKSKKAKATAKKKAAAKPKPAAVTFDKFVLPPDFPPALAKKVQGKAGEKATAADLLQIAYNLQEDPKTATFVLAGFKEAIKAKMTTPAQKKKWAALDPLKHVQAVPTAATGTQSGLPAMVEKVAKGKVKVPKQKPPAGKTVAEQKTAAVTGLKDYAADLEQITGKKGSQDGGLFKDKQLNTYHYLKWTSTNRARNEALATALYAQAGVPVPNVTTVMWKKDLITKSDWLDGAKPMSAAAMAKSPQVRRHFVVDAWLANWDVAGNDWDNIVDVNGVAYRVDMGGAMLFGGMGKGKQFGPDVPELLTLRNPMINHSASAAFKNVTKADLTAGAKAVAGISDAMIDKLVAASGLPEAVIPERPQIPNIRQHVASILKQRRDYIAEELLGKKPAPAPVLAAVAKELTPEARKWIEGIKLSALIDPKQRKANLNTFFELQLGKGKAAAPALQITAKWESWQGSSSTPEANRLRWALASARNRGPEAVKRLNALLAAVAPTNDFTKAQLALLKSLASSPSPEDKSLVTGAKVSRLLNAGAYGKMYPTGKVRLWRVFHDDQRKHFGWTGAKEGDKLTWTSPLAFGYSASSTGYGGGAGSMKVMVDVDPDDVMVSQAVNSVKDGFPSEKEVLWVPRKGKKYTLTVVKG